MDFRVTVAERAYGDAKRRSLEGSRGGHGFYHSNGSSLPIASQALASRLGDTRPVSEVVDSPRRSIDEAMTSSDVDEIQLTPNGGAGPPIWSLRAGLRGHVWDIRAGSPAQYLREPLPPKRPSVRDFGL